MVLYGIPLAPLAEEVRAADPGLLSPFYADDVAFNGFTAPKDIDEEGAIPGIFT